MSTHARVGFSKLASLGLCPGKVAMEDQVPTAERSPPGKSTIDGTRRHALLEWRHDNPDAPWPTTVTDGDGAVHQVIGDDIYAVTPFWDYLQTHPAYPPNAQQKGIPSLFDVEKTIELGKHIGFSEGFMFGTPDVVAAWYKTLEVIDEKYGFIKVEPDALQLKACAVAAMRQLLDEDTGVLKPGFNQINEVKLTIYQPTHEPALRSMTFPLSAMEDWVKEIKDIGQRVLDPNAPRIPGETQCRYCEARNLCPERTAWVAGTMFEKLEKPVQPFDKQSPAQPITTQPIASVDQIQDLADRHLTQDLASMTNENLGRLLDLALLVEGYFKDAKAEAVKRISAGNRQGLGWKHIEGRRSREWIAETEDEIYAGLKSLGIKADRCWTKTLLSPAQAEKAEAGPKGKEVLVGQDSRRKHMLEKLFRWKIGSPRLVPESDPAPAIDDAGTMFQSVAEPLQNPINPADCPWL